MRHVATAALIGLLGATTAACSSDAPDEPTPSASASALSDDDLTARIVAGEPPTDALWAPSRIPSGWTQLETEQGSAQWRVGDSACLVGIQQPAGIGADESPTDEEIADQQVQQIGQALGGSDDLDVTSSTVMVPATVDGSSARVEQKFVEQRFTAGSQAQGLVRAHRYGDFALISYVACGKGDFDAQYSASIEGFLDSLTATLTY